MSSPRLKSRLRTIAPARGAIGADAASARRAVSRSAPASVEDAVVSGVRREEMLRPNEHGRIATVAGDLAVPVGHASLRSPHVATSISEVSDASVHSVASCPRGEAPRSRYHHLRDPRRAAVFCSRSVAGGGGDIRVRGCTPNDTTVRCTVQLKSDS